MKASPNTETAAKSEPVVDRATRAGINENLLVLGLACAVNRPPTNARRHVVVVRLPRSSSGKAPRRGVHVPLSSFAAVKANTCISRRRVQGPKCKPAYIKRKDRK